MKPIKLLIFYSPLTAIKVFKFHYDSVQLRRDAYEVSQLLCLIRLSPNQFFHQMPDPWSNRFLRQLMKCRPVREVSGSHGYKNDVLEGVWIRVDSSVDDSCFRQIYRLHLQSEDCYMLITTFFKVRQKTKTLRPLHRNICNDIGPYQKSNSGSSDVVDDSDVSRYSVTTELKCS
jgi:hypothetical protein